MTRTSITYTTIGSDGESCGHAHRTVEAAARCVVRHADGCVSQGGYSDRMVVSSDGESWDVCRDCQSVITYDDETGGMVCGCGA
jgi:hypothetical protein